MVPTRPTKPRSPPTHAPVELVKRLASDSHTWQSDTLSCDTPTELIPSEQSISPPCVGVACPLANPAWTTSRGLWS